ncbi:hypothetical protein [Paenibacillus sp. SAFN-117]|uniref:hypothetical protein n=1 Tax=Paenibacillus sp. SAFN-117 TaxID=3436860 RepID=UPI003F810735
MNKFDFVNGCSHFDNEPYSLIEDREEQRQAEQMFLNKLAEMLNDFLIRNQDSTQLLHKN